MDLRKLSGNLQGPWGSFGEPWDYLGEGIPSGLLLDYLKTTFGLPWDHLWTTLDYLGTTFGPSLDYLWTTFELRFHSELRVHPDTRMTISL